MNRVKRNIGTLNYFLYERKFFCRVFVEEIKVKSLGFLLSSTNQLVQKYYITLWALQIFL
jgi:hypothetical protein